MAMQTLRVMSENFHHLIAILTPDLSWSVVDAMRPPCDNVPRQGCQN